MINSFITPHSVCLKIGFWQGSFVWNCYVFNLRIFLKKKGSPVFLKRFSFFRNVFSKLEYWKHFQLLLHKSMPISQTEGCFESSLYRFSEEPMLFLLALNWNLQDKAFFCVKIKTNTNFLKKLSKMSNRSFFVYLINHI